MRNTDYSLNQQNLQDQIKYKKDFIKHFPRFIEEKSKDYALFFCTFTFKDTTIPATSAAYHEFFDYLRRRIDQRIHASSRVNAVKPILFLIPEKSYKPAAEKMHACIHFHGLLFVHKETLQKFDKKCLSNTLTDEIEEKPFLHLAPAIISPYPKDMRISALSTVMNEAAPKPLNLRKPFKKVFLSICDYRIYPIEKTAEIFATFHYSCKNFLQTDFDYDDFILSCKFPPRNKYRNVPQ